MSSIGKSLEEFLGVTTVKESATKPPVKSTAKVTVNAKTDAKNKKTSGVKKQINTVENKVNTVGKEENKDFKECFMCTFTESLFKAAKEIAVSLGLKYNRSIAIKCLSKEETETNDAKKENNPKRHGVKEEDNPKDRNDSGSDTLKTVLKIQNGSTASTKSTKIDKITKEERLENIPNTLTDELVKEDTLTQKAANKESAISSAKTIANKKENQAGFLQKTIDISGMSRAYLEKKRVELDMNYEELYHSYHAYFMEVENAIKELRKAKLTRETLRPCMFSQPKATDNMLRYIREGMGSFPLLPKITDAILRVAIEIKK